MNNSQQNTNKTLFNILALAFIFLPSACLACEPIIPLTMLYSGTTIFGAIALKSVIGLFIAIVIKCAAFYWKSEPKGLHSVLYMIAANAYSTIPGVILGLSFSSPGLAFIVAYPILLIPAKTMMNYKYFKRFGRYGSAAVLFLLLNISMVLFIIAMNAQEISIKNYWILKIIASILAIAISFLITVACEDGVISQLYAKNNKIVKSYLEPVAWANAVVFLVVMGLGAAVALPKRFASPNSLIGAIKLLVGYFGLG